MFLHTPAYVLFLVCAAVVNWLLPGKGGWRKAWLLLVSYIFYGLFSWQFAVLLLALTSLSYWIGAKIPGSAHPQRLVWLSLGINLGVLGIFKYFNFFIDNLRTLFSSLKIPMTTNSLFLLLPVGISFYVFQAISYTLEISRGKILPAGRLDFALYMAFFPKLLAGPIVRPAQFFKQLEQPSRPAELGDIVRLLLTGLVKKMIIADALASLADVAFRAAELSASGAVFPTPLYIQGFYLYAFQIYADFSGYTDIARASGMLFGLSLPENFQQPYLSSTPVQFWNRWHISLTQWFREYLYFPLTRRLLLATRRKAMRLVQVFSNLVTMLLIGLWHGAAWTFVAWGLWHGLLLSLESLLNWEPVRRWQSLLGGILTFHLVGLGWILFRSDSFTGFWNFIQGLWQAEQMSWLVFYLPSILIPASLLFILDLFGSGHLKMLEKRLYPLRPVLAIAVLVILAGLSILNYARGEDLRPFIYGNF